MKVYIIAGEPSGDLLASGLMGALRRADPGVEFRGVGGESMAALGLESSFDIKEISVMGVFEVVPRLPLILRRVRRTADDIEAWQPDVLVTVDSWGFVSALITKLRKRHTAIPIVHYVAPQVWAWKQGRAKNVSKIVDRLMMLLPGEGKYFEKYGLRCDFVGHPVIERMAGVKADPQDFRRRHSIPGSATLLTVLPGSRRSEIDRMIPIFKDAAQIIRRQYPDLHLVIPTVGTVEEKVRERFSGLNIPIVVVTGEQERYNAFLASRAAIAKSGTVSLELAALGTPHLIAYTFNRPTNWLVNRFVKTPYANLVNILAGREIIPEFVLEKCLPEPIAACILELLGDPAKGKEQIAQARQTMRLLQYGDTMPSDRAAQVVLEAGGAR